ncbi:MAG: DUF4154 domain-containing protein [Flavobacteriales bacterium]|nr:DUF4154 domain-containing protein [Flavobacteriales bacterium]
MKPHSNSLIRSVLILLMCFVFLRATAQNNLINKLKNKFVFYGTSVTSGDDFSMKKLSMPKKQALQIFNFFKYTTYPNADTLTQFNIQLIGDSGDLVLTELQGLADNLEKTKKGKNLFFSIKKVADIHAINNPQILYFDQSSDLALQDVYSKLQNRPTLIVSNGYPYGKSMINFIEIEDELHYEINEQRCTDANLKISMVLLALAVKSEKEWESLLDKMENLAQTNGEKIKMDKNDLTQLIHEQKQLMEEIEANTKTLTQQKDQLKLQTEELTSQRNELSKKEDQIASAKTEIGKQQQLIQDQLNKIALQQANLENLNSEVVSKQHEVAQQQTRLETEKQNLLAIQQEYAQIEKNLKEKEVLVQRQNKKIDEQGNVIITKESTIEEQKNIIWMSIIFLVAVSALGGLAYRSYRLKNKANKTIVAQKEEIEEQHREITDSINYAKRIQNAILPPLPLVKEYLPDSFILYQPKDIVAGDFYWMEKVNGHVIYAAADCTGHGVPGAMVSVVCHTAMNRAVNEFMLTRPHEILDKTREIVLETFEKSSEDVNDGMDIALSSIDFKHHKLCFAGANNGLCLVRDHEVIQVSPDKQPIGKYRDMKPFTNQEVDLKSGDVIYTFTDGFPDQFGGPKGKKFMYKAFRNLLLEIHQKPMEEQHEILINTFNEWRGDVEQVDDICVIGVKI